MLEREFRKILISMLSAAAVGATWGHATDGNAAEP
jgi:hypothetical protein